MRFLLIALLLLAGIAGAQDAIDFPTPEEAKDIATWIPQECCRTNNCCFKITSAPVTPLPDHRYRIKASGQIVQRKDYSRDGKFWRCACDEVPGGGWNVHPAANTRCLFPPMELY